MSNAVDVAASALDVIFADQLEDLRTSGPVHIIASTPAAATTVECQESVPGMLPDGTPDGPSLLLDRPVWYPGGAGFYVRWPLAPGDVALGVVSDRSLAGWSLNRTPGPNSAPTFPHYHHISDTQVLPLTDQPAVPESDPGLATDLIIGGPAGVAIRVGSDGVVTVTTPTSSITLDVAGSVTIEVLPGQSVNVGGPAAVELPKWPQLEAAIDSMLAALVAAGAGVGFAGAGGAQTAWNLAKVTVATTKAKGE